MHAHDRLGVSGPATTVSTAILLELALWCIRKASLLEVVRSAQRLRATRTVILFVLVQLRVRGLRQMHQTLMQSVGDLHVTLVVASDLPLRLHVTIDGRLSRSEERRVGKEDRDQD